MPTGALHHGSNHFCIMVDLMLPSLIMSAFVLPHAINVPSMSMPVLDLPPSRSSKHFDSNIPRNETAPLFYFALVLPSGSHVWAQASSWGSGRGSFAERGRGNYSTAKKTFQRRGDYAFDFRRHQCGRREPSTESK